MRKEFTFSGLMLAVFFLSSCAATGALVGIGAFSSEAYEEVRSHRLFSDQGSDQNNETVIDNNETVIVNKESSSFGFECTKLKNKRNQSKCFDEFSKVLSKRKSKFKQQEDVVATKKDARLTKQKKVVQAPKQPPEVSTKPPPQENIQEAKRLSYSKGLASSYLENWVSAWEHQDVNLYLSFYSKQFKGLEKNHTDWETSRQHVLKNNNNISIEVRDIQVYQSEKTIELNFMQTYKSDAYSDVGIKELIFGKKGNTWEIIEETWMSMENISDIKALVNPTDHVTARLFNWLKAWENQNVNSYLSFYSNNFKTPNDRSKWEASRHRALKANTNLSIQVSDIQISQSAKIIELNFLQTFKSDTYSDVGIKELVWAKKGNDWNIIKETWTSS